jgi:broad specificity phosphatase PhoE
VPVTEWAKFGGTSQLTSRGKVQMYEFGKFIGDRYTFLNRTYDVNRAKFLSTPYDRTIQTAAVFGAGLYRITNDQKWNQDSGLTDWNPMSIRTSGDDYTNAVNLVTQNRMK